MKILITGIHGFVGSNLVEALKNDHIIYGLDIVSPTRDGVRFTFPWDSLDKPGEIPEVDAVVHLAGKAHDTKNQAAADVYFNVNTGLTKRIFDWFLAQPKCRKLIFFSTAKAAADKPRTYRKADDSDPYVGVGRNDPCPCGSGKKFKHCHGRNLR